MPEKKINFICPKCGSGDFISNYKTLVINNEVVYKNKHNEVIICLECGMVMNSIPKEIGGTIGKFQMMNREDKIKSLKRRSQKHYSQQIKPNI